MTEKTRFENARAALDSRIDDIIEAARGRARQTAKQVAESKKPVKMLAGAGVKLSKASHRATDKLIRQQAKIIQHNIDAVAGRFKAAAKAESFKDLVTTQVRLVPENASRFIAETRDAFGIVANAGVEMRGIVVDTVTELRGKVEEAAAKEAVAEEAPAETAEAA